MTSQQIHSFILLSKTLNYTNAAFELGISPSTLSRQIVLMEDELNVQLFLRDNHSVALTTCGKHFLSEVLPVYEQYQRIVTSTQQIYQGYTGKISIGILLDVTLNGAMQKHMTAFRKHHPDMTFHMERGSYKQLTDGLRSGRYDCIICFFFAIDNMLSLQYRKIEPITEGILISRDNPLSKKSSFDPVDFKNQTFILVSAEDNNYVSTGPFEFFRKNGIYPSIKYAPDLDTATLMVEAGQGVSFSYGKSIGSYNPSMKFIPLKEGITMTNSPNLVLAWDQSLQNPSAKLFVEEFRTKRKDKA